jgi:hypothetical protein
MNITPPLSPDDVETLTAAGLISLSQAGELSTTYHVNDPTAFEAWIEQRKATDDDTTA